MTQLIKEMEDLGAGIDRCEAKVFGGGCMFPNDQEIGVQNIEFALMYLDKLKVNVSGMDVGLNYSRRIRFHTDTGKVMVKRLRSLHNKQISEQEAIYQDSLTRKNSISGDSPLYPGLDE